jgi:hypothetical protein
MREIERAKSIYKEEGLSTLLTKGYQKYAPEPINFRYGAKRTLTTPHLFIGHIRRKVLWPINLWYNKHHYTWSENNMMDEDWDNLVILDACRYDIFAEVSNLEGSLSCYDSPASRSYDFMEETFSGKEYHDTVYITTNSHIAKFSNDIFHDVVNLWKTDWDSDLRTIPPGAVTRAAIEAQRQYPNKRLLIHYMQPHSPFIGEEGLRFRDKNNLTGMRNPKDPQAVGLKIFPALNHNLLDIEDERLRELYEENLEEVLGSVDKLIDSLNGKTIVTADHGELLGERAYPIPIKTYGHPALEMEELTRVPWLVIDTPNRRKITAEKPVAQGETDTKTANERLRALGYKT